MKNDFKSKIKYKLKYGTAIPAIIMILIVVITLVVFYFMNKDNRQVKTIEVGDSLELISKIDTNNEVVQWTTSDVSIATVNANGIVTGISPGDVDIKLTVDGEVIDKYRVVVYSYDDDDKYISVDKVILNITDKDLYVGDKIVLQASISPEDATNKNISWESSNQNIATVNQQGEVTAIKEGKVEIIARGSNKKTAKATINVKAKNNASQKPNTTNEKVSNIIINQGNTELKVGATKHFSAIISPANVSSKIIWKSTNPNVASISEDGKLVANKVGFTFITASTGGKTSASVLVHVSKSVIPELNAYASNNSTTIGNNINIFAENNTGSKIEYIVKDPGIISVDENGLVTTKRTGKTTITVKSDNIEKDIDINVSGYRVHFIKLDSSGDAILLEDNGKFAMIDTGTEGSKEDVKKYLDNYGIDYLEFVVLTHPHNDHNSGIIHLLNNGVQIGTIYQKKYTFKDSTAYFGSDSIKSRVDNIISTAQKYGVNIVYVDDTFKEGQYKTLGDMRIYFYNVIQRVMVEKKKTDVFDYNTSQYWANRTENPNSIATLITVGNHSLLTTGDVSDYNILSGIIARAKEVAPNLDVYKISHHGYYNCTGQTDFTIGANYYIATNSINTKFGDGNYALSNDTINYNGEILKACFAYMNLDMCNVYYSNDSTNSIIVNFSNSDTTLSGGGLGRNISDRCK